MALTLSKEDGTGMAGANSYASVADGDAYFEGHLYASAWTAATSDTKAAALVMATRLVDSQFQFNGYRAHETQALQWPRGDLEDDKGENLDEDTIPVRLKNATAELACYLIESDTTAALASEGIASLSIGSIKMDFNTGSPPQRKVIPDAVLQMVSIWGKPKFGSGPVRRLVRA